MKKISYIFVITFCITIYADNSIGTINENTKYSLEEIKNSMITNATYLDNISNKIEELEKKSNRTQQEKNLLKKLNKIKEEGSQLDLSKKDSQQFLNQEIQKLKNYVEKLKKIKKTKKTDAMMLQITEEIIQNLQAELNKENSTNKKNLN